MHKWPRKRANWRVTSSPLPITFKIWQSTTCKIFCAFSVITYVFLFGPSIKPLYHRCLVWPTSVCDRPRHKKEEEEVILFHNCVLTPDVIRSEVEYFKLDFNNRIKQVLFNSLLTAYYMTFVPLCFAQVSQSVSQVCEVCSCMQWPLLNLDQFFYNKMSSYISYSYEWWTYNLW